MWHLLIITAVALQTATGTSLVELDVAETRANLLCGNYSIDVGQTQYIKSKNFDKKYPKNYRCDYTFHCTDYASSLVFNCNKFNLQNSKNCKKDFLRVYDNNAINTKYCGKNSPQNVTTGDNFLGVVFKSNKDAIRGSGFLCSVTCEHVDAKTTTTTTPATTSSTTSTSTQPTTSTAPTTAVTLSVPEAYEGCKCGIAQRSSRIVGGSETEVGEYPWHVAIAPDRLRSPYCGASLLNNLFIITAAHCVHNIPTFDIILGEHDWLKVSRVAIRKPAEVTVHPNYDPSIIENDIAIIKLDNPVNLNGQLAIKHVCLPDPATDFTGMKAIATGWGLTSENGFQSSSLQEVEVTVTSDSDCPSEVPSIMCAGEPKGGKDTCNADSGGPLVVEVNGQYVLAGVTSIKMGCAKPGNPGFYTKVQSNLDWIHSVISEGKLCKDDMPTTTVTSTPTTTTTTTTTTTSTSTTTTASTSATEATTASTSSITSTTTAPPTTTTTTTTTPPTTTTMVITIGPTKNPVLRCACGIPTNPLRAAGSDFINNYPWTVALISKSNNQQFCSGTLINTYFILTAKTCVTSYSNIQIRANAQDITSQSASRYINRNVVTVISNQDLALLKMDNPLSLTRWDGMKPACLPSYSQDFTNKAATHSGYGNLYPSTNPSSVVKKTDGSITGCSAAEHVLCFQPAQANGFCGADIGGPIVSQMDDGRSYLAGIALKDNGCSTANNMVLQEAAKVSEYYQWIWDSAQDGRFCGL